MNGWPYALLCLFLPIAWGLVVVLVTNAIESWRQKRIVKHSIETRTEVMRPSASPEYHI